MRHRLGRAVVRWQRYECPFTIVHGASSDSCVRACAVAGSDMSGSEFADYDGLLVLQRFPKLNSLTVASPPDTLTYLHKVLARVVVSLFHMIACSLSELCGCCVVAQTRRKGMTIEKMVGAALFVGSLLMAELCVPVACSRCLRSSVGRSSP